MRRLTITITSLLLLNTYQAIGQQYGLLDVFAYNLPPSKYADSLFRKILEASDYTGPAIRFAANYYVPNAMAISKPIYQWIQDPYYPGYGRWQAVGSERFILYNPQFMTQMQFTTGSHFAVLAVLAHELGHHRFSHSDNLLNPWASFQQPWEKEMQADYYSGKILARLGAQKNDLTTAQRLMFSFWGSTTHPDSFKRIREISRGYREGGGSEVETDLMAIFSRINKELTRWYPGQ